MKEWAHSLRLTLGLFALALVLVSFKISNLSNENSWLCAITALATVCATMVQNDWRDRFQDTKKGIYLANNNPKKFFLLVIVLWVLAGSLSLILIYKNINPGILALLMIVSGLIYSETRKVPMLSIVLVCLTWASLVLFPVFPKCNSFQIWLLSIYLFLTIFGREIITDLKDIFVDRNYKWTIPQKLSIRQAEIVAVSLNLMGLIVAVMLSAKALLGIPFMLIALFFLFKRKDYRTSKTFFDLGMATVIIMLWV